MIKKIFGYGVTLAIAGHSNTGDKPLVGRPVVP
jgi:hypothetical protein